MHGRAGQGKEKPDCRVRHLASCRLEAKGTGKEGILYYSSRSRQWMGSFNVVPW